MMHRRACAPGSKGASFPSCGPNKPDGACTNTPPHRLPTAILPAMTASGIRENYDALVIGAGPAGGSAALMLARAGWNVVIVEKSTFPRRKVCGEFISATSLPILFQTGLGENFQEHAGPEVRRVGLFARDTVLEAPMPKVALS